MLVISEIPLFGDHSVPTPSLGVSSKPVPLTNLWFRVHGIFPGN